MINLPVTELELMMLYEGANNIRYTLMLNQKQNILNDHSSLINSFENLILKIKLISETKGHSNILEPIEKRYKKQIEELKNIQNCLNNEVQGGIN